MAFVPDRVIFSRRQKRQEAVCRASYSRKLKKYAKWSRGKIVAYPQSPFLSAPVRTRHSTPKRLIPPWAKGLASLFENVILMADEKKPEDKSLVVKSAVGDYLRSKDVKVSSELYDELNVVLKMLLDRACKRCEGNGRKTVMVQDL